MDGAARAAVLVGLAVSAALISTGAARADDPDPSAPPPSAPVPATTSTTVFPSSPPSPGASELAGTVAGVGREHPGRAAEPSPSGRPGIRSPRAPHPQDGQQPADEREQTAAEEGPSPHPGPPRAPARRAAPERERQDAGATDRERVMRVLPLGTGMALAGLGLGFIGLRLRRR
ncbi:hypothetical protein [Streptomyces sp. NPDC053048]|uniref:hypothetical protein n=1 Tax=Streptomyces sp. NPDC053048 TaxID=3365694 RepID=UPI0037D090A3